MVSSSSISNSSGTSHIRRLKQTSPCRSLPGVRLWRGARVLKEYEGDLRANAIFLRGRVVARGNFRGNRFAGTEGVSPAKWPSCARVAYLEWTLWPPDQDGLVHDLGQGAESLLEHVWENC